jgi:phage shock protein PspC (stress-responsive transcriptional regulator)
MDKITRIHLAKVPYEIDTSAQKELKEYLDTIRSELDHDLADEIMTDIEVRITEILSERKIKRNDVITAKDIEAVQEQLGSPDQFTDDAKTTQSRHDVKRLLRDRDGAYIAGVASGIGAYFSIDPIFVRLVFIALTFLSGLGILLYILLWLLVPEAKSSSDKLIMRGEAVTAATLQQYRSTAQRTIANLKLRSALEVLYTIFKVCLTALVAFLVLLLLSSIGFASAVLYTPPLHQLYSNYHLNYLLLGLIWLFTMTVIGLMMIVLLRIWRRRSSSLKIAFVVLASTFILTLASVAVVVPFIANHYRNQYGGNKLTIAIPVHTNTTRVPPTELNLTSSSDLVVSYVVTSQPMHATYQAYPGMGQPQISIENSGGTVTIQSDHLSQVVPGCVLKWCRHIYLPVKMTLYGPALQKYTVNGGAELDVDSIVQKNLSLVAENNSSIIVTNSYADNFSMSTETDAMIDASDASSQTATINAQYNSTIFGPASGSLDVTLPENCDQTILTLAQAPASIILNGQTVTTQEFNNDSCVSLNDPTPLYGSQFETRRSVAAPAAPQPTLPAQPALPAAN